MNPQDLITQVRAPEDEEAQSDGTQDTNTVQQNANPTANNSCFWCCGGHAEENVQTDVEMGRDNPLAPKQPNATLPKQTKSNPQAASVPDRSTINSPRASGGSVSTHHQAPWRDDHLLPPPKESKKGKKCLVLDLDETLVHSSFKPVDACDFVIPVEIENQVHKVYVCKRPHVDEFMKRCGEIYEVVIFTASVAKYADPVLDLLDTHKVVDWRLFRESCSPFKGSYVKDMGRMGRDLSKIMIIDNSPHSFAFNPENAIPCETWFSDKNDRELLDLIPVLEQLSEDSVLDVREKLKELQISGLEALKRELAGGDSEYTSGEDSEFETDSE